MNDKLLMHMCLELAKKAWGEASPNPYVGALLLKEGKIIGRGWHRGPGHPHAEIEAITDAEKNGHSPEGATLYCNLEPCCHTNKRTPPCAQRLIKEKIKKAVIANLDPNPKVAGKGAKLLRQAGVEVETGLLEKEGARLNEVFFHHIVRRLPFVHLKWAQTLDGKIATRSKSSKWITGSEARERVHWERGGCDAIMVGAETLRQDNPSLTARREGKPPKALKRIVVSTSANFDPALNFFSDEHRHQGLIALPDNVKSDVRDIHGVEVMRAPSSPDGGVDLKEVLKLLYQRGVCSLYVEGGSALATGFLRHQLFDRLSVYIAPKILGEGLGAVGDLGILDINQAQLLSEATVERLGDDFLLNARRKICSPD